MTSPESYQHVVEDETMRVLVELRAKLADAVARGKRFTKQGLIDDYADEAAKQARRYYEDYMVDTAGYLTMSRFDYERESRLERTVFALTGAPSLDAGHRLGLSIQNTVRGTWRDKSEGSPRLELDRATRTTIDTPRQAKTQMRRAIMHDTSSEIDVISSNYVVKSGKISYHLGKVIARRSS